MKRGVMLLHYSNKRPIVLAALLVLACTAVLADAKPSEKQRILKACIREFGAAVDSAQSLFAINEAFVLQAKFDKRGY